MTCKWSNINTSTPVETDDHNQESAPVFLVTDGNNIAVAAWVHELNAFGGNGGIFKKVTHWMPAPALPEIR